METDQQRKRRLYTRYEHGNLPVDVHEREAGSRVRRRLELYLPDGSRREFGTQGDFLSYLYGSNNRIPFNRYFRLDDSPMIEVAGVSDILEYCRPAPDIVVRGSRGIDLENRGIEVRKILFARFGRKIVAMGYDPHDVLQEVYRKLLVANQGDHPYDPSRASFGHYVYMVCDSALRNYRKKEERRTRKLRTGIAVFEDNERVVMDVGDVVESRHRVGTGGLVRSPEEELAEGKAVESLCTKIRESGGGDLACRIVEAFGEGVTRRELVSRLGATSKEVKEAMEVVRENATEWADDEKIIV